MTDNRLKNILRRRVAFDTAEAEKTARILSEAFERGNKNRFTLFRRIINVISYISPLFWCIQAAIFLIFILIDYDKFSYLPLIPIVAVTALCEILKNAYFEMWELERACKYDLRSLLVLKLLITGVIDFMLLITAVFIGKGEINELLHSACIYVITCVICLTAFNIFRNKSLIFVFSVIGVCLSIAVYILLNFQSIDIFCAKYIHWWCICLAVFTALYFSRIKKILRTEDVYDGR